MPAYRHRHPFSGSESWRDLHACTCPFILLRWLLFLACPAQRSADLWLINLATEADGPALWRGKQNRDPAGVHGPRWISGDAYRKPAEIPSPPFRLSRWQLVRLTRKAAAASSTPEDASQLIYEDGSAGRMQRSPGLCPSCSSMIQSRQSVNLFSADGVEPASAVEATSVTAGPVSSGLA